MNDARLDNDLAWDGGGAGRVVSLDGEAIVVRSEKPFAPGSRPEGKLTSGSPVRFKTHRCRRIASDDDALTFTIEGRLLDATRELRAELAVLIAARV
jgi:hypothetical protein